MTDQIKSATFMKAATVASAITIVAGIAVLFTVLGSQMEKSACLVRAYESRIDVDLGKKVCAFTKAVEQSAAPVASTN